MISRLKKTVCRGAVFCAAVFALAAPTQVYAGAPTMVVVPLKAGEQSDVLNAVAQVLPIALANTGRYTVMSSNTPEIRTALAQLEANPHHTTEDRARAVGAAAAGAGASFVLAFEARNIGAMNMIIMRVFNARDGSLVVGETINVSSVEEVLTQMPQVANKLAASAGAAPQQQQQQQVQQTPSQFLHQQPPQQQQQWQQPPPQQQFHQPPPQQQQWQQPPQQMAHPQQMQHPHQPPPHAVGQPQAVWHPAGYWYYPPPMQHPPSGRLVDEGRNNWKNRWWFIGGGVGFGTVEICGWYNCYSDGFFAARGVVEFAPLSWLSFESGFALGSGESSGLPVLLKIGGRPGPIELTANIGWTLTDPVFYDIGGTFGFKAGPGILFARFSYLFAYTEYTDFSIISINLGYKVGVGPIRGRGGQGNNL